ncbi:hypothetical protein [Actinokineospora sp. NBRC 105648]|uniref:hypothetical protein n=1 Tax=Actinokineospora sp. NBRC 105648 TaxID=3032206 RepID=UPI0024A2B8AD|nr:hypothetical protein [Actinokineospora sp. NBRC 105648]GLZ37353.1 hypothetical protein Acsp05_09780 [Actinokineospora sp. NBRC 105648]
MAITVVPTAVPTPVSPTPVSPPRQAHRAIRQPAVPERLGRRLAASVDRVLADPGAPVAVAELMAGLAWTAAAGETCRVTRPVADVRHAIAALRAGDTAAARRALDHAAEGLRDAPTLPAPRPIPSPERRSL